MKRYLMALLLCMVGMSSTEAQELTPQYRSYKENLARMRVLSTASENISSDTLEVFVGDSGHFTMGIPNGPILIFGHPSSSTSYATARIDSNNYVTGSWSTIEALSVQGLSVTGKWAIADDITVQQTLQILESDPGSGNFDTARIDYELRNEGAVSRSVGFRQMIDTMLGANDGAPLRVPNVTEITTEKDFVGNDVPNVWEAFDDLLNPTVVAKGTLISGVATRPDRFVGAQWGRIFNAQWDFVTDSTQVITDSAVGIYWNPTTLAAGQSRRLITFYGIGSLNLLSIGPLRIGITAPAALDQDALGGRGPIPFNVNLFLQNDTSDSSTTINNITARLDLPTGVTIDGGGDPLKDLGSLAPDASTQTSWSVDLADNVFGLVNYSMVISASVGSETVQQTIQVPMLENLGALFGKVTDDSTGSPISGVTITTTFDKTGTTDDFGDYLVPRLDEGSGYTVTAYVADYSPKIINNVAIVAGDTTFLDLQLTRSIPMDYRLVPLSPDPNPVGISTVMEGGTANRYYRVVAKGSGKTAEGPVAVNVIPLGIVISQPDGILKIPVPATDVGSPGENKTYLIKEIDSKSLDPDDRLDFAVRVEDRAYQVDWTQDPFGGRGYAFQDARNGHGSKVALNGTNTSTIGADFDYINITRQLRGMSSRGDSISASIGANVNGVSPIDGVNGISEGAVTVLSEDTYQFDYSQMPVPTDAALRFILINDGLIDVLNPRMIGILGHLERSVADQDALDNAYRKGARTLDVKSAASATAATGVDFGESPAIPETVLNISVRANTGEESHAGARVMQYAATLEAGLAIELSGEASIGSTGSTGINFRNRSWFDNATAEIPIKTGIFNTGGSLEFDGFVGAGLQAVTDQNGVMRRLILTLLKKEQVQIDPQKFDQTTMTYTIKSTPELLNNLANTMELSRDLVAQVNGTSTGFEVEANTFSSLLHAFFTYIYSRGELFKMTYAKSSGTVTEQANESFGIDVKNTSMLVNLGTSFLHAKTFDIERGVWVRGRHYALESYEDDPLTPGVSVNMNGIQSNLIQNMQSLVDEAFDHTQNTIVAGANTIIQTSNATLNVPKDILNSGTQIGVLNWSFFGSNSSVTSTKVNGERRAVSNQIRTKALQSSNQRVGIGGFHQLTPENTGLRESATLSITYDDSELVGFSESELRMYANKGDTNEWIMVNSTVDAVTNKVTASVDTFWTYTLAPLGPSGNITLQIAPNTLTAGTSNAAAVTSMPIMNNDNTQVKNGTIVTVVADGGTLIGTDLNTGMFGLQLATTNGTISFQVKPGAVSGMIHIQASTIYGDVRGEGIINVVDTVKPATPNTPAFTTLGVDQFSLHWPPNNDADLAGYKIHFDTDTPGAPYDGTASILGRPSPVDVGFDTTSVLSGLNPGTMYYLTLTAYDLSGNESSFSQEIQVKTAAAKSDSIDGIGLPSVFTFDDHTVVSVVIDSASVEQDTVAVNYFGTYQPFEFPFAGFTAPLVFMEIKTSLPDSSFQSRVIVQYSDSLLQAQGITDESNLHFAYYNASIDSWTMADEGDVNINEGQNVATLSTNHFSLWALAVITPTGIDGVQELQQAPEIFSLEQNYPNPFNPTTTIRYALPQPSHVTLKVYNIIGQEINTLVSRVQQTGFYNLLWNGNNANGMQVASGVYFYRLVAKPLNSPKDAFAEIRKMVLVK